MISLTPRYDLFRFEIPRDWVPAVVLEKYQKLINQNSGVIQDPVSYLNESIQGITIPGISDLTFTQSQPSQNSIIRTNKKINIEPKHDNSYMSVKNPLEHIQKEFTVTFRQNQGLLNYFMIYETVFYRLCKPELYRRGDDVFYITLLSELGTPTAKIKLFQPTIAGLDGLEFSYSKVERQAETFQVTFNFNNIDFDFCENLNII